MVDRQARLVFLDEHKRGAVDHAAVANAESFRHGADEMGLAGPERTDQGDYGTWKKGLTEAVAERRGGGKVGYVELNRVQHVLRVRNHALTNGPLVWNEFQVIKSLV